MQFVWRPLPTLANFPAPLLRMTAFRRDTEELRRFKLRSRLVVMFYSSKMMMLLTLSSLFILETRWITSSLEGRSHRQSSLRTHRWTLRCICRNDCQADLRLVGSPQISWCCRYFLISHKLILLMLATAFDSTTFPTSSNSIYRENPFIFVSQQSKETTAGNNKVKSVDRNKCGVEIY